MTNSEAISILEKIKVYAEDDDLEALNMALAALDGAYIQGAVDAIKLYDMVSKKHGEWVDDEPNIDEWSYKKGNMPRHCSACGHRAGKFKYKTYKFCPWCGADMRGESE